MGGLIPSDADDEPSRAGGATPAGMLGRWLAALPGTVVPAFLIGTAIARSLGDEDLSLAVASGGFMAVCAWTVLAPLAILQRSAVAAWIVVALATALAGACDVLLRV